MKERVLTGVIGGALFVTFVLVGGWMFKLFILLIALVAMGELLKINEIKPSTLFGFVSLLLMLVISLPPEWMVTVIPFTKSSVFLAGMALLLILTVTSKNAYTFDQVGFVLLSSLYIGYGFYLFIVMREFPEHGIALVFFILFLIWTTDSGAYFVGRKWGKHKLWPEISPKKTIEGAVGGMIAALIIGTIFYLLIPNIFSTYSTALLVIFIVSIFGQMGDLVQSALKRHYGVKDSGTILPGHGGLLDRFDSLIFVMLILHVFQFI